MNIAITGSTGLIGKALTDFLKLESEYEIQVFDHSKHNLLDIASLRKFVEEKDIIIHLAGVTTQGITESISVNTLGTMNLLEAIRLYGAPNTRIIYASTFAVYKEQTVRKMLTEGSDTMPRNHYGLSKLLAEDILDMYRRVYGLTISIFRLSNVYGPNDRIENKRIIPMIVTNMMNDKKIYITGTGNQVRDFIFIDDVVDAFYKQIISTNSSLLNICSGKELSINSLIEKIELVMKKKAIKEYDESVVDNGFWICDPTKAEKEIGFKAKVGIDEGLKRTVQSYLQ